MQEFYPFFLVIFAAVLFSTVFHRFHVPWVIALILGGIAIGPHGLGVLESNATLDFIAQIGLVFLMFMAGLEVKFSTFQESKNDIWMISLFNGAIPFVIGFGIGYLFGYGFISSMLLGIIFISSSIAVIIPSLEASGLIGVRLGKSIVAAAILEDAASLVLLSILLQTLDPITSLPLPIFYLLLLFSLIALRWMLPKIQWFFVSGKYSERDLFQQELRTVFVILIGTVIIFELLGLHPIIAGFFAGFVLSGSIASETLKDKLRTISYGLFIPTFFIILGMKTDISVFARKEGVLLITTIVVFGSMVSKFIGGWIGGKLSGFTSRESALIGASTIPQLSTTLAVVFTGVELGLLRQELISPMVILSIVTVFVAPILMRMIGTRSLQSIEVQPR
jgi:Kef-type K+ transport system membrane component KefB